jgi:hypothetical protein
LGDRCVKSSMTAAFAHATSERSASITGASAVAIRTAFVLRRMKGGGETGTPACIGAGAAAASATNISLSGADGFIDSANAVLPVHASASATNANVHLQEIDTSLSRRR